MDIKSLINKVIASKGILRVPSWWMKKLLTEIIGYIDSGDSANAKSIDKAKKEADGKITTLESEIKYDLLNLKRSLHTQKCFVVKTGTSVGYVVVDGVAQDIPANTQKIVTYADTFSFYNNKTYNGGLTFIGLAVADSSSFTDMSCMFYYCNSLTSLDLSGLDTSAVTNMEQMFSYCRGIESINLSGIDTSSVATMREMFSICSKLTSIDLSGFNTSSVTDMGHMFRKCGFTSLDLSSFNTSLVTNMNSMFSACRNLTSIDLSGFNTSKVTNMYQMFGGYRYDGDEYTCGFTSLDLSSFNTSSVTDMGNMFSYCNSLTSLNLSSFDTSSVTNMSSMFYSCKALTSLDLSSFDTSAVTTMWFMFEDCSFLTSLILGPNFFKTSAVTNIDFRSCSKWTNDTVVTSLVTNSYNRASAGLNTLTLELHKNTKAVLSNEQKAAITSKGYTIA